MENKTNRVQVRLPEEIYNLVESESKKYGISISEYIRLCVINSININDLEKKINSVNKKTNNALYQLYNLINMVNFLAYDKELQKQINNPKLAKDYTSNVLRISSKEYEKEVSKMRNE